MENINIKTTEKYNVLTPAEGYKITNFVEGDDILNYNSFSIANVPIARSLDKYRAITIEEDKQKLAEQDAKLQELFEIELQKLKDNENK